MKIVLKRFLALCLLAWLTACSIGNAQNYPELMFVVDSSGSMQSQLEGRMKLDIAKEVLLAVVAELPSEVRIGLAAYGHRSKNDCQDVEILIPPGGGEKTKLISRVKELTPMGMTPIALALTKVAGHLESRQAETTIVLLTDGLETCGGNPLGVVKKLKQEGLLFVLYVVGYDIKENEKKELMNLAEEGDGRYFSAHDTASLLAALEIVRKDIEGKVEKAKTQKIQKKTGLGKLHLAMPADALKSLRGIQIRRKSDANVIKKVEISAADTTHPLPAGEYELLLDFANPNYRSPTSVLLQSFDVDGNVVADVTLGALAFNVAENLADNNISALLIIDRGTGRPFVRIEPQNNDYYLFKTKPAPAGIYDMAIQYYRSPQATVIATNIAVQAGKMSTVTLDSGFVLKKPGSTSVTGWDLIRSGSTETFLQVRRGSDNQEPLWRRFIVPPGVYDLKVYVKGMDEPLLAGMDLKVRKGETLEFDAGL
ncbi:MAG: VWA domain-containing protein [Verrucomicrobia bacterium]|nr:VWA domain-containing protein [Verrucomicrobiota bacterium]